MTTSEGREVGNAGTAPTVASPAVRRVRRGLAVVLAGLLIQLVATLGWSPGAFVIAAMVGAPMVLIGTAMFLRAVLKVMMQKGAL